MQQVVNDAVKRLKYLRNYGRLEIESVVRQHPMYDPDPPSEQSYRNEIVSEVEKLLPTTPRKEVRRLALHYTEDNNKPLFEIFKIILQDTAGLSYQDILNRMTQPSRKNSDIITISHYCRKLLRTNFVSVSHVKEGIIVVSRLYSDGGDHKQSHRQLDDDQFDEPQRSTESTFFLKEFSLTKNILLNLSSVDSYQSGGLTKDDVCQRLYKQSEKKTVSRIIEGCSAYRKQGYRKGKIYEFKFKSSAEYEQVVQQYLENEQQKPPPEVKREGELLPHIEAFLQQNYPTVHSENLLLELINTQIKEYTSSIGRKECKRQCPPSKLMRYSWILNRLDEEVDTLAGLQAFIIEQERQANVGKMHKRTLVTILEDLKLLGLVLMEDDIIYPAWKKLAKPAPGQILSMQLKRHSKPDISINDVVHKKAHRENKHVTESKHALSLFTSLLTQELDMAYLKQMKHCFRLLKKNRRKQYEMEAQRASLLHILTENNPPMFSSIKPNPKDFEDVCDSIDRSIAGLCKKEQLNLQEEINPYIKRHLRCHFTGRTAEVVRRFGRASVDKLKMLSRNGYLSLTVPNCQQLTAEMDCTYRLTLPRDNFFI